MPKILNTIGRKNFTIVLFSIMMVIFLVLVSMFFFDKVRQTSRTEHAAYKYELSTKNISLAFERYVHGENEQLFLELTEMLKLLTLTDGIIGEIHRLLQEGTPVEKAAEIYDLKTGRGAFPIKNLIRVASLMNSLEGTSLTLKLVEVSQDANTLSTTWRKLFKQYVQEKDLEIRK